METATRARTQLLIQNLILLHILCPTKHSVISVKPVVSGLLKRVTIQLPIIGASVTPCIVLILPNEIYRSVCIGS